MDYAKWDRWAEAPDDPVTKEEAAAKEAQLEAAKDAEFEKLNPEFCQQFKDDLKKRDAAQAKRVADAVALKNKGNKCFVAKQYEDALRWYHKALKLQPFQVPFLTNIAQAHLKLEEFEDAAEFCDRALHVDAKTVKALFRRAVARRAMKQYAAAVADLQAALVVDPDNRDLIRELKLTEVTQQEAAKERGSSDPHVLLRVSGQFDELCAAVTAGMRPGAPAADPPAVTRKSLLTIADACSNPLNRHKLVAGGTLARLQAAVAECDLPEPVLNAALATIEIVASHRDVGHVWAVAKPAAFLPALLDVVKRYTQPPAGGRGGGRAPAGDATPTGATEAVAHACSILQIVAVGEAAGVDAAGDAKVEDALAALDHPVETLLLLVASLVARSVLNAATLTSLAMQAALGALANLAQRPAFRPAFRARPPGLDGAAATGFVCRPLVDLPRLPLPPSEAWDTVCSTAVAALCNASHQQPEVLAAVRECGALPATLDILQRRPPASDLLRGRAATLLARLSQDAAALKALAEPDTYTTLTNVFVACDGRVQQLEDGLIRVLAASTQRPAHRDAFVAADGIDAAAAAGISAVIQPGGGPLPRGPALGNLFKALIVVADVSAPEALHARLLAAGLPDLVLDVIKRAPSAAVRKNAAVVLARMATYAPSRQRIKDARGMEVLLALSKSGEI